MSQPQQIPRKLVSIPNLKQDEKTVETFSQQGTNIGAMVDQCN